MRKINMPMLDAPRRAAVIEILQSFDDKHLNEPNRNIPLDLFLRYYFLERKKLFDSKARASIVDHVYYLTREKSFLTAICKKPETWSNKLKAF